MTCCHASHHSNCDLSRHVRRQGCGAVQGELDGTWQEWILSHPQPQPKSPTLSPTRLDEVHDMANLHIGLLSRRRAEGSSLPTDYCSLATAYYPLPSTHCLLPTTYYALPTAYCLLPTAYYPLPAIHCLLPTIHCLLPTAYCLLPTTHCLLPTTYYLLPTPYSLLPTPYSLPPTPYSLLLTTYY